MTELEETTRAMNVSRLDEENDTEMTRRSIDVAHLQAARRICAC
jgi:hypothetical protein